MTKTTISLILMWVVIFTCMGIGVFALLSNSQPPATSVFPQVAVMPEDLDRLEGEAYKVCATYANLDLSGMVKMCRMVGFNE